MPEAGSEHGRVAARLAAGDDDHDVVGASTTCGSARRRGGRSTSGVVSPQRNSRAGRGPPSNISSRTRCLLQPHCGERARVLGADHEQRRPAERPPVRAPGRRRPPSRARARAPRALVLRWSEIDSGASAPNTVTTDATGAKPRSTCSGSHGLHLLVLGEAQPDLARVAERRAVETAREPAAGQADDEPQRAPDRHVGPPAGAERADRAVQPDRVPHRAVDDDDLPAGWVVTAWPPTLNAGSNTASHRGDDAPGSTRAGSPRARRTPRRARASPEPSPAPSRRAAPSGSRPPSIAFTRVAASAGSRAARRSSRARTSPRARRAPAPSSARSDSAS